MTLILAHRNRKLTRDIQILDSIGDAFTIGSNDVVRVRIGKPGSAALLSIDSESTTISGSTIEKNVPTPGTNRVQISEVDIGILPAGVYTFEVALIDGADGDAVKHVDHQVLAVKGVVAGV